MKRIEIVIKPNGETIIEAFGYNGRECLEATRPYEEALGETVDRKMKAEYYTSVNEINHNHLRRG
jgi:hypothetical protein